MFEKDEVIRFLNEENKWKEGVYISKSNSDNGHTVSELNDTDTWHKVKFVKPASRDTNVFEIELLSKMDKIISLLENQIRRDNL